MYKKLTVLILFVLCFLLNSHFISFEKEENEMIDVEVRGRVKNPGVFSLERGSSFADLKKKLSFEEDSDMDFIADNCILYHNQIISVPEKKKRSVCINSADIEELCTLKGIGESTALKIIEYRENIGPFQKVEDLMNVKGIGEAKFAKIKDQISV